MSRSRGHSDPPIDRRLAQLAARQHNVVRLDQLRALGYTSQMVKHRVYTGRLHRIHRGVYAVGSPLLSLNGRRMAAVLACGHGALLSHRDAGRLHGVLRGAGSGPLHVSAVRPHTLKGIHCHVRTHPHPLDQAAADSIPVTSLDRTYLDLAAELALPRLIDALEEGQRRELLDARRLHDAIARCPGHHGIGALRQAIAALADAPLLVRSQNERRLLELLREAGLPLPSTNVVIAGEPVDAVWIQQRLIVEIDAFYSHGQRRDFEDDRRRDLVLQLAGWRVVRITDTRLKHAPQEVTDQLRQLLATS